MVGRTGSSNHNECDSGSYSPVLLLQSLFDFLMLSNRRHQVESRLNRDDNGRSILVAVFFEGSLAAVAIGVGWLAEVPVLETFHFNLAHFALGVAGSLPLLAMMFLLCRSSWAPLKRLTVTVEQLVNSLFVGRDLIEIAAVSLMAGIGEEFLFRGLIQGGILVWVGGSTGIVTSLILASLFFGLCHPITITYVVVASIVGVYLGAIWLASGNLLVPVTAHASYDFLALLYLLKVHRKNGAVTLRGSNE